MSHVADWTPREWLSYWARLGDWELREELFGLCDEAEVASEGSDLRQFILWGVDVIRQLEQLRTRVHGAFPTTDPVQLVDVLLELGRAHRELGVYPPAEELFEAVFDVIERRKH